MNGLAENKEDCGTVVGEGVRGGDCSDVKSKKMNNEFNDEEDQDEEEGGLNDSLPRWTGWPR